MRSKTNLPESTLFPQVWTPTLPLVIRIDNRLFERQEERRRDSGRRTSDTPARSANLHSTACIPSMAPMQQPIPMMIHAVRGQPRGLLTQEEKSRRYANKLCRTAVKTTTSL